MPVEVDLIAQLVFVPVHPSIGHMGTYLTLEVGVDVLLERHVLKITPIGVGLIALDPPARFDRFGIGIFLGEYATEELLLGRLPPLPALTQRLNAAPDRIPVALRLAAECLVDGLHVVEQVWVGVKEAQLVLNGHLVAKTQGPLDRDAGVAEVGVVEGLDGLAVGRVPIPPDDPGDLVIGDVPTLVAQAALAVLAAAGRPDFARVEQADLAPGPRLLAVGEDPDVGADAGVVEHLLGAGR